MPNKEGLYILDDSGQEKFVHYSDLEDEIVKSFIRPIGGFVFPADLFALKDLPEVPFYIKDWLPRRGRMMTYGPAKTGKSMFCLQSARSIASGQDFIGIPTQKATVLYLQFELGEEILQGRIRNTGKSYPNVYVGTSFSLKLDTPEGRDQVWRAMEEVQPGVLCLDPWYKAILADENEGGEIRPILDFLDTLIEAFDCSIILIHHSGKDTTKRGRGSSVLEDWVDSYISMKPVQKKGETLKAELQPIFLRHAALPPKPVTVELGTDFEFHPIDGDKTVKEQVLAFTKEWGKPIKPGELFKAEIGSNTSVYSALKELVNEGRINKIGRGLYES